jgi:uncharacterized protein (DUF4415 family)
MTAMTMVKTDGSASVRWAALSLSWFSRNLKLTRSESFLPVKRIKMNKNTTSDLATTDWERLNQMSDTDIDYSDIPPLGERFFERAQPYVPRSQRADYVELEHDVAAWFQQRGADYPHLINVVLRKYIEMQQEIAG